VIFSKEFYLDKIYADISLEEIIGISFAAFLFTVISSVISARRSVKIKPSEALKNE
jgi:ABC-type lipoprotein release transport system permease subunit